MPTIIPIRDLKKTSEMSRMCKETQEPIYVTKNGYGDMVIMSMQMYEERMLMLEVYSKLEIAEEQVQKGEVLDAVAGLKSIRAKYNV
jgi:Phd_YefM.